MEETIQFIYQEIRNYNINANESIDFMFMPAKIARIPINIQNHLDEAILELLNRHILELREVDGKQEPFLTELGFRKIY